jgi:hypothetical protein
MSRVKVVALLVIASAIAFSVAASAYSTYAKWAVIPVLFYANPANADVTAAAAESALQAGMDVWHAQSSSPFRFVYGGRVSDTSTGYDSRNVAIFRNASSGSVIATTYSWWVGSTLVDADIVFWDGGFHFFTGTSGCGGSNAVYIEDIAAHELGHALGLNHSTATSATMYPSYSTCSQSFRTLASDDIAGVEYLYPPVLGDTAPTVSIATPTSGASFAQGTSISFSGSASDKEDGILTSLMTWTSSLDGTIGSGGAFSKVLSVGNHVITARVTDSGGLLASKQVTVTVTSSFSGPNVR